MNFSELFIARIVKLRSEKLQEADLIQVRKCLLDYLGVTAAGSMMLKDKAAVYLKSQDERNGNIPLPGMRNKTTLLNSAFIHGMYSHVAELDDGERFAMMHPGAPLFSVLLPAWIRFGFTSEQFEKAVLCGYEASILLARAMQPQLKIRGYHGTGITGTIGAAIGLGIALDFTQKQLLDVLSAACTSASGILKVIKDESVMKPLNVAFAAQQAISAVLVVKAGFTGADDVLGGNNGFIRAYSGVEASDTIDVWEQIQKPAIHGIYVKPYASCRHCHAPVEAALKLRRMGSFNSDEIEKIIVKTHLLAIDGHDHTEIRGINSAKMSIPYCVASALKTGSGFIDAFTDTYIKNPYLSGLVSKTGVEESPEMTKKAPAERSASVTLFFKDQRNQQTVTVIHPKGEPENPVTDSELKQKTESLMRYAGYNDETILKLTDAFSHTFDLDAVKYYYM
ncbi:MAG: MmgE/PrpD family protein [Bacteroidetes bacterium]|nr:MAG: MmgE/PrpD family protein [Bacteroidota bacterium]